LCMSIVSHIEVVCLCMSIVSHIEFVCLCMSIVSHIEVVCVCRLSLILRLFEPAKKEVTVRYENCIINLG